MPFNKEKLAAMVVENDEYLDKEQIAERFGVTKRTIERLTEEYAKKLKKSSRRRSRKIVYLWSDVLHCAKLHVGSKESLIPLVRSRGRTRNSGSKN